MNMLNNLLAFNVTEHIVDFVVLGILIVVAIVGLFRGFMKNGLNNVAVIGTFVLAIVLTPVIVNALGKAAFMAGVYSGIEKILGFVNEAARAQIAKTIVSVIVAIILLIVIALLMKLVKWILRKLIKPERGVLKVIDRILGCVVGIAIYGCLFLGLIGSLNTVPAVKKYTENSYVQKVNFLNGFCEKNLNIGNIFAGLGGGNEGGGNEGGGEQQPPEGGEEGGGSEVTPGGNEGGGEVTPGGEGGGEVTPGGESTPETPENE